MRAGYLDTIHGFGDFEEKRPFLRKYAKAAYHVLSELGLMLKVWTNHGDRLSPNGDQPWATRSAMIKDSGKPLAGWSDCMKSGLNP